MRVKSPIVLEALEARQLLSGYIDLSGVMPAALDLPHINMLLRRGAGEPLAASVNGTMTFNIDALLSTGASGIILSSATADALGVTRLAHNGQTIIYSDVGLAASDRFNVAEALTVQLAPGNPDAALNDPSTWTWTYSQSVNLVRAKISQDASAASLDIAGMPALAGKVLVIDPKPANSFTDTLRTYVYSPGTAFRASIAEFDPGIPEANLHIQLSYASFSRFSSVTPDGALGPTIAPYAFIGPNPVTSLSSNLWSDTTPGVTVRFGATSATGSWLLDTGSSASIISLATAEDMGVHYAGGTYNTASPLLLDAANQPLPNQFTMDMGGAGGTRRVAGFYLTTLEIPTTEGQTLRFYNAPVLVSDITVMDPRTLQTLTLDGVLGMNYLAASGQKTATGFSGPAAAAFDWITLDQPAGLLGLSYVDPAARPTASLNAVNITRASADSHTFTITYSGRPAIDWDTLGDGDIIVVGPDGLEHTAWFVGMDAEADGPVRVVTYEVDGPDFEWGFSDNGVYTVQVRANGVADTEGRFAAAARIGTFTVSIPDTTPPRASTDKLATPRKGATYTFQVTYTDDGAVKAGSIGNGDVIVTGPRRFKQAAKLISKSSRQNAGTIIATYRIIVPGKSWDASDKGAYTVHLQRKQIADAAGNFTRAAKIGKFTYAPPKKAKKTARAIRAVIPPAPKAAATPFSTLPIRDRTDDPVWR